MRRTIHPAAGSSDRLYRLLVESIHDYAIFVLDPGGIVCSWNPGAERFKGYQAEEIIGRNFECFYSAQDRAVGAPAAALAAARATGRFEGEGWRVRKNGEQFWAYVVIDAIFSPDGDLIGFAKITRDVTERYNAQAAEAANRELYRVMVESIEDYAINMLDPDGIVSSWNHGAERFKGYRAEEILGRHFACFYTEQDRAAGLPAAVLATAAASGKYEGEGWRVRKDGTQFWAHVVINAIRGTDGALIGFARITRDLTDLRAAQALEQANHALHERHQATLATEKLFREMFEASPSAVVMTDESGQIAMLNQRAERLFGYPRAELLGQNLDRLLPAAQPDAPGAATGLARDGSRLHLEIGRSPIQTEQGSRTLLVITDITERLRLEEQVRQSQKMEAFGRVAAGVAHDFNNLLLALGGGLELLLDEVADRPQAMEAGQIALRAAQRGKTITDRLLALAHRQDLIAAPIAIKSLFHETQQLIRHLFQTGAKARTALVVVPPAPGLAVLADRAQLQAALINLAVNARDAMESAGGCLRLSAFQADADPALVTPGGYTVISVADTGPGMDAATLARACEPFFSTKGQRGTGLGLPMVQAFARQSGGNLHIASIPGQGTTVDLWLPAAEASPRPADPAQAVRSAGNVLLVDDSQDALLVVSAFLRSHGFAVTACTSADLGLAELAQGTRFDAIVTDLAMPGMHGVEFLKLAAEIAPTTPAMVITGFSDTTILSELNNVAVLRKPFNRAELCRAVQHLIVAASSPVLAAQTAQPNR